MFATRHMHLHLATWEVLKWLAILTLASVIAAVAARLATGESASKPAEEPQLLPQVLVDEARPMLTEFRPTLENQRTLDAPQRVWQLLEQQRSGNYEEAMEGWKTAPLTCNAEAWRHIGMGQAALGLRDMTTAREHLETALGMDNTNAVARYYLGILRLEQAARANEWPDALEPTPVRFASHPMGMLEPTLTRSMYELAARMELEAALETAHLVPFDEPLCERTEGSSMALEPTVRDLLIAMRANDFEGKAHHMLGYLVMEHGSAEQAEQHLDSAAALGQAIVFGYQDLGAVYERQHNHLDALRAYAKAMKQGGAVARPAQGMLRNLRLAIIEEF